MMIEKKIFLLEINTQPGLTSNSLLQKWQKKKFLFLNFENINNNPTCEKY